MNALNQLLFSLQIEANVHHNGQYCGDWAVDTSGTRRMTFHVVSKGRCFFELDGQVVKLSEGDAVFLPSDAKHSIGSSPKAGAVVNEATSLPMTQAIDQESTGLVCGNFSHQHPVFEKLLKQMPKMLVVRKLDQGPSSQIVELMLDEARSSNQHSNVLLNRLADCLFYLLVRNSVDIENGVYAPKAKRSDGVNSSTK